MCLSYLPVEDEVGVVLSLKAIRSVNHLPELIYRTREES